MRVLSPATFEVRRPPWVLPMLVSLHLLLASLLIAWAAALSAREEWAALWWLLPGGLAWLAAVGWLPLSSGRLRWDGQHWQLSDTLPVAGVQREGSLIVALDGGSWLLLRFRPLGEPRGRSRGHWMVLARHGSADGWCALRRTVYSPRPEPAAPSAQAVANPSA